ncbi:MAG: hypothetical protein IT368_02915 [Candidatus Hydrogenedentes bacterium]|nr:hypothetical protein [Candidatus Hydrogenedentota bacterium]
MSFAALAADMDDLPRPVPEPEEASGTGSVSGPAPVRPGLAPEEQNFRVLTASSPKATPYWITALFTGGMACILLLPLFSAPGFRQQTQPWMSYCVLLLSAGTLVWSFSGLAKEGPSRDRWLCLIGLALALVAGVGAWLLRSPGTPYG